MRKLLNSRHSPKSSRRSIKEQKPSSSEGSWVQAHVSVFAVVSLTVSLEPGCVGVAEAEESGLDDRTLTQLVEVLSEGDVPWKKLAEKLGMLTLTHLYQDRPVPCQHLLQHYKVTAPQTRRSASGGGRVAYLSVTCVHSWVEVRSKVWWKLFSLWV